VSAVGGVASVSFHRQESESVLPRSKLVRV
jgi:hypothetical protein